MVGQSGKDSKSLGSSRAAKRRVVEDVVEEMRVWAMAAEPCMVDCVYKHEQVEEMIRTGEVPATNIGEAAQLRWGRVLCVGMADVARCEEELQLLPKGEDSG